MKKERPQYERGEDLQTTHHGSEGQDSLTKHITKVVEEAMKMVEEMEEMEEAEEVRQQQQEVEETKKEGAMEQS